MDIPPSHPRYLSLMTREKLVEGVKEGITAMQGLIAHGRGEAFDYIMGERSNEFAIEAEKAAVAAMLLAKHPVISVNGNAAVLSGKDIAELSTEIGARVEINIFHFSEERVGKIKRFMERFGIEVLAACDAELEGLKSARRIVDSRGIYIADVVLVPLEDGDRCEILKKHGKKVIAIDLNPLSRTSLMADISNMVKFAREMKKMDRAEMKNILRNYDNRKVLASAIKKIVEYLNTKAREIEKV